MLRKRKTEKEKEGYNLRRELYFFAEKRRRKRRYIFVGGKYIFLQKNGAEKGGKYLEKENEVNISRRKIYILWGGSFGILNLYYVINGRPHEGTS